MGNNDPQRRLERLRAIDIMIPLDEYPQVSSNATLREAVRVMESAKIEFHGRQSLPRVLLVTGKDGTLVGHVRRRDVLAGLEPKFLNTQPLEYRKKLFDVEVDPNLSLLTSERVIEGIRALAGRPVTEVMKPIRGSVKPEDSLVTIQYEMTSFGVPLLPVVRDGKALGVVRTVEVFHELAKLVV